MNRQRIRYNIVQNLIFSILPVGLFLVTVPIYIHLVGTERYGILSLVWVLAGYVGFMNFGSGDALIRGIAEMSEAEADAREQVVWSGIWTTLCLGSVAAVIVWLVGEAAIIRSIHTTPQIVGEIHRSIPWVMLSVVSSFVYSAISGVTEGLERFIVVNVARLIEGILAALLPLGLAMLAGPRLDWLVAMTVLASLLPSIGLMVYLATHLPLTRIHRPRWSDSVNLLRFGGWLTVTSVVGPIMTTLDRFVVGAVLGPTAVSHYVVPQGMVGRFAALPAAIGRTLFPRLASLSQTGGAKALSGRAIRAVGAVMAPLVCGAIMLVAPFLTWWIGADFAAKAAPVARILLFAMFFNSVALIPFNHMRGTGDARTPALIHLAELVPFLVLAWACIHAFGIVGAALAWSVRTIADFVLMCMLAKLDSADVLSLWPLVVLLVLSVCGAAVPASGYVVFAAAVALGSAAAFMGCLVSSELRELARKLLPRGGALSRLP